VCHYDGGTNSLFVKPLISNQGSKSAHGQLHPTLGEYRKSTEGRRCDLTKFNLAQ